MNIETPTNPQEQAETAPPNPVEGEARVQDGSQGLDGDELAGLVDHPELEETAPPTGEDAGRPAPGEPEEQAGEGVADPGEGQEPTPEAGSFSPINITYNGKSYTVDSADKATELIQKGLDYQVKMARLGQERGKLQMLNEALNDPGRAEQVKSLLTGQPAGKGGAAAKPQDGQAKLGEGILIPVEGPDGKTVYVAPDEGAVSMVSQIVQQAMEPYRKALEGAGQSSDKREDPYVAALSQERKEAEVSSYIDAHYPQGASWKDARDKVIEAMAADGIFGDHPANHDPNAWLAYYMRLSMAGQLPSRQTKELETKPKVVDKSELKAGARTPTPSSGKPPQTKTDDLVLRAMKPGASEDDWLAAIGEFIDHPGFKTA